MLIRLARGLVLAGVAALIAAILFSFLAPVSPLADSVAHFRLHLIALAGLGAASLALLGGWRAALLALLVAGGAGLTGLSPAFPDRSRAAPAAEGVEIALAQFNLNFANGARDRVAAWILAERPDVVTLQEVSPPNEAILAALRSAYPHQTTCPFAWVGRVAVLSRLPLAPGANRGCANGQGYAWLRVMKEGRAVTVAAMHLLWPYPYRQGEQLDRLEAAFAATPRPVLLGGDFNAAPWSHAAARVAAGIDGAILGGLRVTIDIRLAEGAPAAPMQIDHVVADPAFAPIAIRSVPDLGSDHRLVLARLRLSPGR